MIRYPVRTIALLAVLYSLSGVAIANCHLDGSIYQEGDVVSGYVCKDGDWVQL